VHLVRASVVYDQAVDEKTSGTACQVSFGDLAEPPDSADGEPHPIEKVRSFFHFPEQELFLNVQVPPAQRAWSQVSLCLDLAEDWPRSPAPSPELFQLGAVPAINLRRENALPISVDGTQDAYPIRHPQPGREFALRELRGVYATDPKDKTRGPVPLRQGVLPGANTSETYELEEREDSGGTTPWLVLRMPDAFARPRLVLVDATWHQPRFDEHATGRLKVGLVDRVLEGIDWRVLGPVRPHAESPMRGNALALIEALSMNMKAVLDLDELRALLGWISPAREGAFRSLISKLRELRSEQSPDSALRGIGIRHIYRIKLEGYDPDDEALVFTFLMKVRSLLDTWNHEASVELQADTSGSPLSLPVQ
jgi:type VI secretion system protein ImpG